MALIRGGCLKEARRGGLSLLPPEPAERVDSEGQISLSPCECQTLLCGDRGEQGRALGLPWLREGGGGRNGNQETRQGDEAVMGERSGQRERLGGAWFRQQWLQWDSKGSGGTGGPSWTRGPGRMTRLWSHAELLGDQG